MTPDPAVPSAETLPGALLRPVLPSATTRGEETDLWWGSYSGWTMLPSFVLCALITGVAAVGMYLLASDYGHGPALARHEFYAAAAVLWLWQLLRWARRAVGLTYRLTTQRLFGPEGFLYPRGPVVALSEVTAVLIEQSRMERWLDVGQLRVLTREGAQVLLAGVREPHRIAALIGRCAERACAGNLG
jgi:hypothetical protein